MIDILYQSLRTSLNVYSTYNTVSDRIGDYKHLLDDYYTKVVERNKMELMDTLLWVSAYAVCSELQKTGGNCTAR